MQSADSLPIVLLRLASTGAILLVAYSLNPSSPSHAALIVVDTGSDSFINDSQCSLREAVQSANTNAPVGGCPGGTAGLDTIDLSDPQIGTYSLSIPAVGNNDDNLSGDLDVVEDLMVVGASGVETFIVGGAGFADRIFDIHGGSAHFTLLSIERGNADNGGAIRIDNASLEIVVCYVRGSSAVRGGGIYVGPNGSLTVDRGRLVGNSAADGGGLYVAGGTVNSQFNLLLRNNTASRGGGGVYVESGSVAAKHAVISDNEAVLDRGGGAKVVNGSLTLDFSSVIRNVSEEYGGGLWTGSTLVVSRSNISNNEAGNSGGGVAVEGGTLTMTETTITGNSADFCGGGVFVGFVDGEGRLSASTLSGNVTPAVQRGAICVEGGELFVENSTISGNTNVLGNQGFGIRAQFAEVELASSTIADGVISVPDAIFRVANSILLRCDTPLQSLGFNLFTFGSGCAGIGSDLSVADPAVGPLADNGGRTQTRALLAGSPALDAGDPLGCSEAGGLPLLGTDQRGRPRHLDGGTGVVRCDIGAYELDMEDAGLPVISIPTLSQLGLVTLIIVIMCAATVRLRQVSPAEIIERRD